MLQGMAPRTLHTIGYEATTVAAFLETLTRAGITHLVDVRRVASSRRPGFAKTSLTANVESVGIAYRHLRAVGTPADGRAAARAGRHAEMRRIYLAHLATEEAQEGLWELQQMLDSERRICILCFEHDPTHCHRSLIASALAARMPLEVIDLLPELSPAD